MAKLHRKSHTKRRMVLVANKISGLSCGHVCEVGGLGISMMLHGVGAQRNYDFHLAMTQEEWEDLKERVDGMFDRINE